MIELRNVSDGSPLFVHPSNIVAYTKFDKDSFPTVYISGGHQFQVRESLEDLKEQVGF